MVILLVALEERQQTGVGGSGVMDFGIQQTWQDRGLLTLQYMGSFVASFFTY